MSNGLVKKQKDTDICKVFIGEKVYEMTREQAHSVVNIGLEKAIKGNKPVIVAVEKDDKIILQNLAYRDAKEFYLQKGKFQEKGFKVTSFPSTV